MKKLKIFLTYISSNRVGGVENTIKLVYKLTVLSVLASHPKLRVSNILILSIAFVLRIAKQAMHTR